jgi:5-methylcytosine-specific restriction endonuclease McrA
MAYWGVADPVIDDDCCLACPSCGSSYLHHCKVAVFYRDCEDDCNGNAVLISGLDFWGAEGEEYSITTRSKFSMAETPSPRRGSVIIEFVCEDCGARPQLATIQHKGCSYLEWVAIQPKPEPEPEIKRKSIKPSLRFEVLKRDDYRCQMCGVTAKDGATLEIDHIMPVSKGGSNDASNLQVLCRDCNAGKSNNLQ